MDNSRKELFSKYAAGAKSAIKDLYVEQLANKWIITELK